MLGYKTNFNYISLKKKFDLIYLNSLIKDSTFIIFFSCHKILNKNLYFIRNEILKKNLKSFIINSAHIKILFDSNFKFLNSNVFFVFCNDIDNIKFLLNLLGDIKIFLLFNKNFIDILNNDLILNSNFNYLQFLLFFIGYNVYLIILCFIFYFIRSIKF